MKAEGVTKIKKNKGTALWTILKESHRISHPMVVSCGVTVLSRGWLLEHDVFRLNPGSSQEGGEDNTHSNKTSFFNELLAPKRRYHFRIQELLRPQVWDTDSFRPCHPMR